ncbi:MAG: TetR/AcrR family transcriptional regulator [Planctomycetota bacterium]|nr:TetR/AcrR family transcriptional regulator [Planctomycetota bacterium]
MLAAALVHLARDGYAGMSIDGIAADAGVGKPSIYRRWSGKADLATAALSKLQAEEPRVVGNGARARLVSHLRGFRASLLRPNGMAMLGAVLAEESRTPELMALFRERILARRRRLLHDLLAEGIASGEIRRDADVDAAVNALVGSFYARYLAGQPIGPDWPERVVSLVWPSLSR